jgi:acetylglutamate kinase
VNRVVVKVGGGVATSDAACDLVHDLVDEGHEVAVVHGAGPQISAEMAALGLRVQWVGGRRVTTAATLGVVRSSLLAVNRDLCAAIGPQAVGLLGDEIGMEAAPVPALGLVGDPIPSRPAPVEQALTRGLIPVVAPLARGPLNVNADEAAAALAVGLDAERIYFLTDVPGVLLSGSVVPVLGADEAEDLLDRRDFEGGIIPKLRAAVTAARLGVQAEIGATAVVA